MVHEADPSWEGSHSMPSFISTRSATAAPAAAAPFKARSGENESVLHVDVPLKRRRVAFDFSALQQQHEEAAWTLTTFFSVGDAATAASTVTAPQVAAGGHPTALGQEVVVATIRCSASDFGAGRVLSSIQPQQAQQKQQHHQQLQQRQQQQDHKMLHSCPRLRVGISSPVSRRPCLVVGPGHFGGKVGLLGSLQPPELIKCLAPQEGGVPKPLRASRTNLSHLTEKEKEDRHRELSRLRYQLKRKQAVVTQVRLEKDVEQMRTYQEALNMAPFVMVVVSAHINNCRVLYINKPVTEKLGYEVANLLGGSFLMMAYPQDRPHLSSVLNECIGTSQPHHRRVLCRFRCMNGRRHNHQQPFKRMDMAVHIGTKGLICNL